MSWIMSSGNTTSCVTPFFRIIVDLRNFASFMRLLHCKDQGCKVDNPECQVERHIIVGITMPVRFDNPPKDIAFFHFDGPLQWGKRRPDCQNDDIDSHKSKHGTRHIHWRHTNAFEGGI